MIRAVIAIVTFGIISCAPASAQDTLTVMSYNIYHSEQPYQEGQSNLPDVANLINKIQPDFVALQEVDEMTGRLASLNNGTPFSLADSLGKLTNMIGYFGKAIDYDGGGYGEGLLSKEPLESKKVMLPIPKGGEKRAALYVETQTASGQPVIFVGTHLCHQHDENRIAQVQTINDYFSRKEALVMIAGDFNFTPDSDPYTKMQKQWVDAALENDSPPQPTISAENPDRRIDYLFLFNRSNWEVLDVHTIDVDYSDHLPVVARVVIHPE